MTRKMLAKPRENTPAGMLAALDVQPETGYIHSLTILQSYCKWKPRDD
jgi:hypothetical protein